MEAQRTGLIVSSHQALVGITLPEDGQEEETYYFVESDGADDRDTDDTVRDALSLAGAWSDLDWDTVEQELDRIRHQTPPSPPLAL